MADRMAVQVKELGGNGADKGEKCDGEQINIDNGVVYMGAEKFK